MGALLLFLTALAWAGPSLELGFHERSSPLVPAAVRAQSRFIYRLDIPFFTTAKSAAYEDLLGLPSFPAEAKEDIEACRRAGLAECVIRFGAWRGSAFLDQSGSAVWTNCHMVHGWISYERQALLLAGTREKDIVKALMGKDAPISLRNAQGLAQDFGSARLQAFVAVNLRKPYGLECSLADDAVKLALSRPLAARGISRAQKIEDGEMLYVGGFPRKTESRAARGSNDSDGEHFYWTNGLHLPKGAATEEYFGNDRFGLALSGPYTEGVLTDGIEGMSGSPVLNERGEVTGIYKGYLPLDAQNKDIPIVSVIFTALRFVEIFSEGL